MLRVTVSQYHGVFASVIAQRPGPNLKSGSQTSVSTRRIAPGPPAALEKSWRAVAGSPEAGEQPNNDLRGHARFGLLAIFRRKLRVAIPLLVVGITPTGNRDAGKFAADTTQLPTGCQPESLAKPARRRSHKATQPQLLTCRKLARPRTASARGSSQAAHRAKTVLWMAMVMPLPSSIS